MNYAKGRETMPGMGASISASAGSLAATVSLWFEFKEYFIFAGVPL